MNEKDAARFWNKVHKGNDDSCWLWQAHRSRDGYGQFQLDGRVEKAHRISYMLVNGPIPKGLCVLHKCDCPQCVNPKHLRIGTQADNARDREERGRGNQPKGDNNGNAKLTEAQVRQIRKRYAAGGVTHEALAREYGVGHAIISYIVNRKNWAHIDE